MGKNTDYHFPFIYIQEETFTKNLSIEHLHRREFVNPIDTIRVERDAVIQTLSLNDIVVENHTDAPCRTFVNLGRIDRLYTNAVKEED